MKFSWMRIGALAVCAGMFGTAMAGTAFAQALTLPPSADIDRVSPPETRITPSQQSVRPAEIGAVQQHIMPRPANAESLTFFLQSVRLEGVTAFTPAELEALWQSDLRHSISLARAYDIADAITAYYRKQGYVLAATFLPPQEIADGKLVLRVAEGRIQQVVLEGDVQKNRILKAAVEDIEQNSLFHLPRIERWIMLLNDLYGAQFRLLLRKGEREGDVVMVLLAQKKPAFDGGLSFDNAGSRFLGPFNATAWAGFNHTALPFQRTSAVISTSLPADELNYFALSHFIPLNHNGVNLVLDVNYALGNPGYTLEPNDIESESFGAAARLDYTVERRRDVQWTGSFGFQMLNNDTDTQGNLLSQDRVRKLVAGQHYRWADATGAWSGAEVSLHRGLDDRLGASASGQPNLSRQEGDPGFMKLQARLSRNQPLSQRIALVFEANGQYSANPLLSSEEFGYGGFDLGRAFDPSELAGDSGVAGLLELQYNLPDLLSNVLLQPFAYYDFGMVWNRDSGTETSRSASSTGFGLRSQSANGYTTAVYCAFPLTHDRETPNPWENEEGARLLLRLSKSF